MTRDDLAARLRRAYWRDVDRANPVDEWHDVEESSRRSWREVAQAAADALGVALDPPTDPRHEAAVAQLEDSGLLGSEIRAIARAIVAALDADRGAGR